MLLAVPPALAQENQSLVKGAKNLFTDVINLQLFSDANLNFGPDRGT